MATIIPYKYYVRQINGQPFYSKMGGPVNDPGWSEVSLDEYNTKGAAANKQFTTVPFEPGTVNDPSPYEYSSSGVFQQAGSERAQTGELAYWKDQVSKGLAKEVMVNGQTTYMPTGSPAAANMAGVSQADYLKSPEGIQYMKDNPDLNAVSPTGSTSTEPSTFLADSNTSQFPTLTPINSKLPSGVLVRDKSSQQIYFIDNGTKRLIANPSVLTPGAGFVDIDSSHLSSIPTGSTITTKPSFNFKTTAQTQSLLGNSGVDWTKPATTGAGGAGGGGAGGGSTLEELLKGYPTLWALKDDPKYKPYFDAMMKNPEIASLLPILAKPFEDKIESGQIINPNIEITPEQLQKFISQATTELEPYYKEVMGNYKLDIDTSLQRMTDQYKTGVGRAEEQFKTGLSNQAESEAQSGTTYGSERGSRERKLVLDEQNALSDAFKSTQQGVQDTLTKGERYLGTSNLSTLSTPTMQEYQVTNQGFTPGSTRTLFTPQGNLMGELPKEQTTAIKSRSSELESDYRQQRILDLAKLS